MDTFWQEITVPGRTGADPTEKVRVDVTAYVRELEAACGLALDALNSSVAFGTTPEVRQASFQKRGHALDALWSVVRALSDKPPEKT